MNTFHFRAVLAALCCFIMTSINATGQKQPDFAFPQKVIADAEKRLKQASDDGNGPRIVRAIMDYGLAQKSLKKTSEAIKLLTDEIDKATDPATRSMLNLILAEVYATVYNEDQWVYDQRKTPDTPLPPNYTEWSGRQFKNEIKRLIAAAVAPGADVLAAIPLKEWNIDITGANDRLTQLYYPTLFDFIACQSINTLRDILGPISLPARILTPSPVTKLPSGNENAAIILDIYNSWINNHEPQSPAAINANLSRIKFISEHITGQQSPDLKRKCILDYYNTVKDSEFAGDILIVLGNTVPQDNFDEATEIWRLCNNHIRQFPAYPHNNSLKNIISAIENPLLSVDIQTCVEPDTPVKISINAKNVTDGRIDIYAVNAGKETSVKFSRSSARKVGSLPVSSGAEIPAQISTAQSFTFKKGQYILVPILTPDGSPRPNEHYNVITATRLAVATSTFDDTDIWVIDPVDGAPVEGAKVTLYNYYNYNTPKKEIGLTDSQGKSPAVKISSYNTVIASKNGDHSYPGSAYSVRENTDKTHTAIQGFTSLSLYHPGDTVEWSAAVYTYSSDGRHIKPNAEVSVILRDANYQIIDSVKAVSDDMGFIQGKFTLPTSGLQGRFQISFNNSGQIGFTVSDYKMPTFAVEINRPQPIDGGNYTISGKATTYSGVPVSDASVNLRLLNAPKSGWRWWFSPRFADYITLPVITDSNGNFSATITANDLDLAPTPDGIFKIVAEITSTTGETRTTQTIFTRGSVFGIDAALPSSIDITAPLDLPVNIVDMNGKTQEKPIRYRLLHNDSIIAQGTLPPGNRRVDWSSLPSGEVDIEFSADDAEDTKTSTILYKPTDTTSPVDQVLWSPLDDKLTIPTSRHDRILVAAAHPTYALYTLTDDKHIIEQKWLKLDAGMHYIEISLPENIDRATLHLNAMADYRDSQISQPIVVDKTDKDIRLSVESFRDKVRPGDTETWRFKVTDSRGNGVRSAIVLDMFNAALNSIQPHSLQFIPRSAYNKFFRFSVPNLWFHSNDYASGTYKRLKYTPLTAPELETYHQSWHAQGRYLYENLSLTSDRIYGARSAKSAMPLMEGRAAGLSVTDQNSKIEQAEDIEAEEAADENDNGLEAPVAEEKFSYRNSEMPLAFFHPVLTTDDSGNLSFSFSVPNANTTWILNALAVSPEVITAFKELKLTASKPLMASPNLPRFMRSGDRAIIPAVVINNSDSIADITTVIEIFDPADNRIIQTSNIVNSLEPGSKAQVEVEVTAPADMPMLGYRIKSSKTGFADGEQSIIPLLPATTPVIETHPFYMLPDSTRFEMTIPAGGHDTRLTLEFCENPLWSVITALPGLRKNTPETSIEAAATIFSAAVAQGILRDNPVIGRALAEWTESNRNDSTLVSLLERNQDLKIILLQATPWMMDARNDTERMARLELLFDRKETDRVISRATDILARLVRAGGWGWSAGSEKSSEWATTSILDMMGRLNAMNWLPRDKKLNDMITAAVKWLDTEKAREFNKYPGGNYSGFVTVRDRFPGIRRPAAIERLTSATVQQLLGRWRDLGIAAKANAAIILENHNYHASAQQILASLSEYATVSPTGGMSWPQLDATGDRRACAVTATALDAFTAVDATGYKSTIDAIRQWLIIQKEHQNWGMWTDTSNIIASILNSSSRWTTKAQGATVTIGSTPVEPERIERMTGYFRTQLPANAGGQTLTITKTGDSPSWGAVYRQYTGTITSIKESSCDDLSITKRLLIIDGAKTSEPTGPLSVGQKVRVELLVKANANLQYITIIDDRPACLEPAEQLPGYVWSEGTAFYRQNGDTTTSFFIDTLLKGTYLITYDTWVNTAGEFISGVATAQSQYAPSITAHSSGAPISVNQQR